MRVGQALAVVLVMIVTVVTALAVGERIREARAQAVGNALAAPAAASATATAAPTRPLVPLVLPQGYAVASARVAPDGRSLVAMSTDYQRLGMFAVQSDGATVLRGTTSTSGGEWLPDSSGYIVGTYLLPPPSPRNADGAVATMKQQQFSVLERDGSLRMIGTGWMRSRPSPDSRWLPVIDDCCPHSIRVLPRSGGPSRLLMRQQTAQSLFILGWDPLGRVLYTEGGRLFAVDLTGAVAEIATPSAPITGERTYSWVSASPDGSAVILQLSGIGAQIAFALTGSGTMPIAAFPYGTSWIGPHEIVAGTNTTFVAVDVLTGTQRDLHLRARPLRDSLAGVSSPYVLWHEGGTAILHVADMRSGDDRIVDLGVMAMAQPIDGGRFLLARDTGVLMVDTAALLAASTTIAVPTSTPTVTPRSPMVLYGDVRDGRVLHTNPKAVIPNDLPPVAGARVSVAALRLTATTDADGRFQIVVGDLASDCAIDVTVTAAGFGQWIYHQLPLYTPEHSGGGERLYIQLDTAAQEQTYSHRLETPRPACAAAR